MKILVTGFEPFDSEAVNPSRLVLTALPERLGSAEILTLALPVSFLRAPALALAAVKREQPDAVLSLGQAGGRVGLTLERIAVNLADARIPDNDGFQPREALLCSGGPDGLFTTLPVQELLQGIRQSGIPASQSLSAGAFVCNALMYQLLYRAPMVPSGFLHLPWLHEQALKRAGQPSLSLEDMAAGVSACLSSLANCLKDG